MSKIICKDCGTENEKEYSFCKNCGADLKANDNSQENYNSYNQYSYTPPKNFTVDNIEGIPTEQVALFVGKKSGYYCPKFSKMEITNSKISWNWAVALLGFWLGPLGAALWCFYRKMYKWAGILVAIGVLITAVQTVLTYDVSTKTFDEILSIGEYETLEEALEEFENFEVEETLGTKISENIDDISCFATAIFMGLFANYLYKKRCVKAIKDYRNSGLDRRYYKLGLASIGGTSGGMLAVGIIIMIAISNLSASAVLITHLMSK